MDYAVGTVIVRVQGDRDQLAKQKVGGGKPKDLVTWKPSTEGLPGGRAVYACVCVRVCVVVDLNGWSTPAAWYGTMLEVGLRGRNVVFSQA